MTLIKNRAVYFFFLLVLIGISPAMGRAQVVASAVHSPISLTVGGTASVFKPGYVENKLGGVGVYVDVNLFHGIGVEAEGRLQRFHEFYNISQDNYLIGPRVQLHHVWRVSPYVKALGGFSNMNFGNYYGFNAGSGRFTTIAFGGGLDVHLTHRITIRAIDAEYQWWPDFLGANLKPYGLSSGASYRIF